MTRATKRATPSRHRWLYVVLLDDAVLRSARFRAANPARKSGMPCIYVGSTGLTPAQRFERHKAGVRANPFVQRHGVRLIDDLCCPLETNRSDEAEVEERLYADVLRSRGYAVWQN